jgi:P-type Ca2+ transporter type 2C
VPAGGDAASTLYSARKEAALDNPPDEAAHVSPFQGLSEDEAAEKLKAEGFNELPRQEHRTPLAIVLEVLREPMLVLLLAGGAISLLLGDLQEALILLAFASVSVMITVVHGDPGRRSSPHSGAGGGPWRHRRRY